MKQNKSNRKVNTSISAVLKSNFSVFLLLLVTGILLYGNVLRGDFLSLDDYSNYFESTSINNVSIALRTLNIYVIINSVLTSIFGTNSVIYHLLSLVIHIINSYILFLIAKTIFNRKVAAVSSMLFLIHPGNSEVVSWLSAHVYLYVALFSLTTLFLFVKFKESNNKRYLVLSIIFYILGVVFIRAPWILIIPPILFAVDIFIYEKSINFQVLKKLTYHVVFISIALIFILFVLPNQFSYRIEDTNEYYVGVNTPARVLSVGRNIQRSFSLLMFPLKLSIVFNYYSGSAQDNFNIFISYILLLGILYFAHKHDRKVFGLLVCMYLAILPLLSPINISVNMAERYYYLSIAFFSLIIGYFVFLLVTKVSSKNVKNVYSLLVMLFVILFMRTFIRTFDWQSDATIWNAASQINKNNYIVYFELGNQHLEKDELKEALENYNKALELRPKYPEVYYNAGLVYVRANQLDSAKESFRKALEISPNLDSAKKALEILN
ncbi:tetratricopeptide repeat protein [Patescibacteria group bacterium]